MEIISHSSRVRWHKHVIYPPEPHIQSFAALLLIKNEYASLDPEANPAINWKIFKRRKKQMLKKQFAQYGKYICAYCKRDDLTIDIAQSSPRRVTIDHIIPLSRGGSLTSKLNMAICCFSCNNKKGNLVL